MLLTSALNFEHNNIFDVNSVTLGLYIIIISHMSLAVYQTPPTSPTWFSIDGSNIGSLVRHSSVQTGVSIIETSLFS
jgi:hypothetical protein